MHEHAQKNIYPWKQDYSRWRLNNIKSLTMSTVISHLITCRRTIFICKLSAQLPLPPFPAEASSKFNQRSAILPSVFSSMHTPPHIWYWVRSHLLAPNVPKNSTKNDKKFQKFWSFRGYYCLQLFKTSAYRIHVQYLNCKGGFIWIFFSVLYSTLLHLPPLRFHCVGGYWDRTQDSCDFGIGFQTL